MGTRHRQAPVLSRRRCFDHSEDFPCWVALLNQSRSTKGGLHTRCGAVCIGLTRSSQLNTPQVRHARRRHLRHLRHLGPGQLAPPARGCRARTSPAQPRAPVVMHGELGAGWRRFHGALWLGRRAGSDSRQGRQLRTADLGHLHTQPPPPSWRPCRQRHVTEPVSIKLQIAVRRRLHGRTWLSSKLK